MNRSPAERIWYRVVEDLDLTVGDGPGGPIDELARQMTSPELGALVSRLKREHRSAAAGTSIVFRGRMPHPSNMRWRINRALDTLGLELSRRKQEKGSARLRELARLGDPGLGCPCGQRHPYGANFYVSAHDAGRTVLLRGPFKTHPQALEAVSEARKVAQNLHPRAAFYSFGTVAMPRSHVRPGALDR